MPETSASGMLHMPSLVLQCKQPLIYPWVTHWLTHCSLLICGGYYWLWAFLLPKWKGYHLRQELVSFEDGAQSNQLRKVPNVELAEWDATHDAAGRRIEPSATSTGIQIQEKGVRTSSDDSNSDSAKRVNTLWETQF